MEFQESPFAYDYPLWACCHVDDADLVLGSAFDTGFKFAGVFQTKERAGAYAFLKRADEVAVIREIPDDEAFLDFLNRLTLRDFTHISFNHEEGGAWFDHLVSIGQAVARIEAKLGR